MKQNLHIFFIKYIFFGEKLTFCIHTDEMCQFLTVNKLSLLFTKKKHLYKILAYEIKDEKCNTDPQEYPPIWKDHFVRI